MSKTTTFGKYRLIVQIGSGGMADVYLAVPREGAAAGKPIVVKKLKEHLARDAEFMTMLVDEARIAARLDHPNLVRTIEIGDAGGQPFLTMEYLDGQPLHRILQRTGSDFPRGMFMSILVDVLTGMHWAHELKDEDGKPLSIVHRDVSPQNVFVTYDGQVKVVDFGIAKAAGRSAETAYGVIKGKIGYMAPEQAGGLPIDRRADVYSVGVLLFEAATGVRMWGARSETDVLTSLIGGEIPSSPKRVDPTLDAELDRICRKALAYVPDDRYATALEMQRDLEAFLARSGMRCSAGQIGAFVAERFADERARMARWIAKTVDGLPDLSNVEGSLRTSDMSVTKTAPTEPAPISNDAKAATPARPRRRINAGLVAAIAIGLVVVGTAVGLRKTTSAPRKVTVTLRATPLDTHFSIDDGPPLDNPFTGTFPEDGREHTVSAAAPGYTAKREKLVFQSDKDLSVRFVLAPVPRPH